MVHQRREVRRNQKQLIIHLQYFLSVFASLHQPHRSAHEELDKREELMRLYVWFDNLVNKRQLVESLLQYYTRLLRLLRAIVLGLFLYLLETGLNLDVHHV